MILSLDEISIWVDSPSSPRTYSFPLSEIYPHLASPPKAPVFLPKPAPIVLNHVSNITPSPPDGYSALYRDTTRKWATTPNSPLLDRPLSILHVATNRDEITGETLTSLSHEYLPTTFTPRPTDRTYFAPLSILAAPNVNDQGQAVEYPTIAAESANVVFPEILPSGEVQMKVLILPADNPAARNHPPEWYNRNFIRPLETPPELNLKSIVMMSLDDATGVLAVAVEGGDIFILEY